MTWQSAPKDLTGYSQRLTKPNFSFFFHLQILTKPEYDLIFGCGPDIEKSKSFVREALTDINKV